MKRKGQIYLLRLDDASPYMNEDCWNKMEQLLDAYSVKPIVGIIPDNQDQMLIRYGETKNFWERVSQWQKKGWIPALHGYTHVYETEEGGINPVNKKSEFAGLPLERQKAKIRTGYQILLHNGVKPELFYAPSHTFDLNTLQALKKETDIRVISDTVADDVYYEDEFFFIPQQSGRVRKLPFKVVTFCYHPNTMKESDFDTLRFFLESNRDRFGVYSGQMLKKRKKGLYDNILRRIYFFRKNR